MEKIAWRELSWWRRKFSPRFFCQKCEDQGRYIKMTNLAEATHDGDGYALNPFPAYGGVLRCRCRRCGNEQTVKYINDTDG